MGLSTNFIFLVLDFGDQFSQTLAIIDFIELNLKILELILYLKILGHIFSLHKFIILLSKIMNYFLVIIGNKPPQLVLWEPEVIKNI